MAGHRNLLEEMVGSLCQTYPTSWKTPHLRFKDTLQCSVCQKYVANLRESTHSPILPDTCSNVDDNETLLRVNEIIMNSMERPYLCNGQHDLTCQSCGQISQRTGCSNEECSIYKIKRIYLDDSAEANGRFPQTIIVSVPQNIDPRTRITSTSLQMPVIRINEDKDYETLTYIVYDLKSALVEQGQESFTLDVTPTDIHEFSHEYKRSPRKDLLTSYGKSITCLLYEKEDEKQPKSTNFAVCEFFLRLNAHFKELLDNLFSTPHSSLQGLLSCKSRAIVAIRMFANNRSCMNHCLEILQLCLNQQNVALQPETFIRQLPGVSKNLSFWVMFWPKNLQNLSRPKPMCSLFSGQVILVKVKESLCQILTYTQSKDLFYQLNFRNMKLFQKRMVHV